VSKHTGIVNKLRAVSAVVRNRANDDPLNITLELTRRCNARCDYCNHWQEQKQTEQDLADYVAVVRRFRPFSVTVCGGEPFMRKDALEIIRAVVDEPGWRYVSIITNGWFLTEDRAQKLIDTGIDQINASVMYTLYSELPAENHGHLFPQDRQAKLFEVLDELSALKRRQPGVVANAQWYFDMIPTYVSGTVIDGCTAGKKTLHISPGGMVRPCAELAPVGHYTEYDHRAAAPVTCTRCFQACRGEVQAPLTLSRVVDLIRAASGPPQRNTAPSA
jgi:MoaA/NifB/PqqE/SkfB family radical SAM enzyme